MQAQIWNYSDWICETDPDALKSEYDKIIRNAGFGVLNEVEHYFRPQGYTKLYLLCESHFAIHTFPEEGKTYIELSSCNKPYYEAFVAMHKAVKRKWSISQRTAPR